jgi:hypothetical protein
VLSVSARWTGGKRTEMRDRYLCILGKEFWRKSRGEVPKHLKPEIQIKSCSSAGEGHTVLDFYF